MGVDEVVGAAMALFVVATLALVFIYVFLVLEKAFAPLDGSYATEITAMGISAMVGAVASAAYALKKAASR